MLKKVLLTISAVVLLACVSDLFAQEEPLGPGPGREKLQRRGRAAKELRKYEGEVRAEKKGFKRDRAERLEGWGKQDSREDYGFGREGRGFGKRDFYNKGSNCRFGQGWGRRGGGRGFGGRGMEGWCPWGQRGGQGWQGGRGGRGFGGQGMEGWCPWGQRRGQGWQGGRGGRGMRRPRGWGGRGYGPDMGMKGHGRRFSPRGMYGRGPGAGFQQRGFDEDIASWHRRGEGMRGQGMMRPWLRGRGGGFGYGRRGSAKGQRRSPAENDFDWDW